MWLGVAVIIAFGAGYHAGFGSVSNLQEALIDIPLNLDARTQIANCVAENGLPDHACTPGAVFPEATQDITCVKGYTKTVRNVSTSLKKQVYREYNIPYPQPFGSYEVDHFIPLTLGGNNDIANLFPESAEPKPGFKEKDLVENYLHEKVCAGEISLALAQREISTNWVAVYNTISPADLAQLKAQYKSWAGTGD